MQQDTFQRALVVFSNDHECLYRAASGLVIGYLALDRGSEAVAAADKYLRYIEEVKERNSKRVTLILDLRNRHLCKINDGPGCRSTAETHEKLVPSDAGGLYDHACFRSEASGCFSKSNQPTEAKLDADRAMVHLTKAVAAGYRDAAHMAKDDDLAALRVRPDFQKLLASITPEAAPMPRVAGPAVK